MSARTQIQFSLLLRAALLLVPLVAGVSSAQTRTNPAIVVAVGDPSCLAGLKTQCLLRTSRRYFEMKLSEDGQMTAIFRAAATAPPNRPDLQGSGEGGAVASGTNLTQPPLGPDALPPVTLVIRGDLQDQVQAGLMNPDDAGKIMSDVANLDGMIYQVPSLEKIETELGLPPGEMPAGLQDLQDLICAHLQVTLGIGPQTAVYLASRLGVERLSSVDSTVAASDPRDDLQASPEKLPDPVNEADAQFSLPNHN